MAASIHLPGRLLMPPLRLCACFALILAVTVPGCLGQTASAFSRQPSTLSSEGLKTASGSCITLAEAALRPNVDSCVSAHIYEVVELADGIRFLDVCPPTTPDSECGFTIISLPADRAEVGDLHKYRNQDVHIRGVIRLTHGRMGLTLSDARQFRGGPEKFRPNPLLARDFDGSSKRMPVRDPNLAASGHHRAFMNNRDQEPLPGGR
jgi:hypothetical protein